MTATLTRGTPRLLALTALAFALGVSCTVPHVPPELPPLEPDAAVLVVDGPKKDTEIEDASSDSGRPAMKCKLPEDCLSGHCAEEVCCDSRCDNGCDSCRLPGREGVCSPLAAGALPRIPGVCRTEAARTCAFNGTCDGAFGCGMWPELTECGTPSCMGTSIMGLGACKLGKCAPSPNQECAPFVCDQSLKGPVCPTMCRSPFDCASGMCDKGVCKGA